jgi:hypothetical protein
MHKRPKARWAILHSFEHIVFYLDPQQVEFLQRVRLTRPKPECGGKCSLERFPGQPSSWIAIRGPLSEDLDTSFAAVLAQLARGPGNMVANGKMTIEARSMPLLLV